MSVDHDQLRTADDKAIKALEPLSIPEKWAALELLLAEFKIRLTQVNVPSEKIRAFQRQHDFMKANIP